jgi:hypothetical protein
MQTYKKQGEILSLTGLRGLAALLVVITHYWTWTKVTSADSLPASVSPWMATSGMGMAIFFILAPPAKARPAVVKLSPDTWQPGPGWKSLSGHASSGQLRAILQVVPADGWDSGRLGLS